jgi:LemA protein
MQKIALLGCAAVVILGLFVGGVLLVMGISSYNHLVTDSTDVDTKWAQVETDYQRRADLIPNLVRTVEGSANFEKSTLTAVINARANATKVTIDPSHAPTDPAQLQQYQRAQDQLSGTLSRLLVVAEKYPDLQSTRGFRDLQAEIEGTENRIAVSRRDFNDSTQAYNTARLRFPTVIFSGLLHFGPKFPFKSAAGSENAPTVDFSGLNPPPAQ